MSKRRRRNQARRPTQAKQKPGSLLRQTSVPTTAQAVPKALSGQVVPAAQAAQVAPAIPAAQAAQAAPVAQSVPVAQTSPAAQTPSSAPSAGALSAALPATAAQVAPAALVFTIPSDLCAPSLVQGSYARFAGTSRAFGDPLLLPTEPETTPAALAAEALVHLTEGWRFLAASLSSLLCNAPAQAVHFAYYAELRAAISLLSSHGMRVSNRKNSYLGPTGDPKIPTWKKLPTHEVVWTLWEAWARTSSAETLLLDQLKILPSVSLGDLKACVGQIATNPALTRWALDLAMGNEHTARNEASYRVPTARAPLQAMQLSDFEFVQNLWVLAEPTGYGLRFEQELVKYLIDAELSDSYKQDKAERSNWRQRLINQLEQATGTPKGTLESFFSDDSAPSPIFQLAFDSDVKPVNMIARAFFLLRLATLMPSNAMTSYPATTAKNWLKDWLENAGIYNRASGVEPQECWMDFEHLSTLAPPQLPLPSQLYTTPQRSFDTHLLSRADALLAWSTSL